MKSLQPVYAHIVIRCIHAHLRSSVYMLIAALERRAASLSQEAAQLACQRLETGVKPATIQLLLRTLIFTYPSCYPMHSVLSFSTMTGSQEHTHEQRHGTAWQGELVCSSRASMTDP